MVLAHRTNGTRFLRASSRTACRRVSTAWKRNPRRALLLLCRRQLRVFGPGRPSKWINKSGEMKRFIRLTREIQSRGKCAWRAWRKSSSWSAVEGNFNIFLYFRKFYTRCASFETDVTMGLPLFQKDKISVFEVVHFETLSYRKMFLKIICKFDLNRFLFHRY